MSTFRQKEPIRVALLTDEPQLLFGASQILKADERFEVIEAGTEPSHFLPLVKASQPDMILLDFTPEFTISFVGRLRETAPGSRLVLWARHLSDEVRIQAEELGVSGFLSRTGSNDALIRFLVETAAGTSSPETAVSADRTTRIHLSPREGQLVTLLGQGLKNKEIASCLGITEGTVKMYLSRLLQKTGARDRFELAILGLKNVFCGQAAWDGPNAFLTEPEADRARPGLRSLVLVKPVRKTGYPETKLEGTIAAGK